MSGGEDPSLADDAAATRVIPAKLTETLNADLPRPHAAPCLVTSHDAMAK